MTEKGRESHAARAGLPTVGWKLRTTAFSFSCRLKVPGMETTKGSDSRGEIDRENTHTRAYTHTHTHTQRKKISIKRSLQEFPLWLSVLRTQCRLYKDGGLTPGLAQ